MSNAFVYIDYDARYDDPPEVKVFWDKSEVLMYEIEGGGCFDIFEHYESSELKKGYYIVNYSFYMEAESWEMPHVRYPVIDELSLKKISYILGVTLHLLLKFIFIINRVDKYTMHRRKNEK